MSINGYLLREVCCEIGGQKGDEPVAMSMASFETNPERLAMVL
jgi:hypothetical protein